MERRRRRKHRVLAFCIPELLLIDEPTEGLGPIRVQEVRDVLAGINKAGVSILLVEHNLKVAMALAPRIYLMGKAHVGFSGTLRSYRCNPPSGKDI